MKRLFSLILTAIVAVTMFAVPVSAASSDKKQLEGAVLGLADYGWFSLVTLVVSVGEGMTVRIQDKEIVLNQDTLDYVKLAYAMTIHKSQGSEFPVTKTDKTTSQDAVVKAYLEALDRYTAKDVQIIVPMKTRSTTAANELNVIIRDIVNPREKTECFTVNPQKDFRVRDRVMQTVNDKDLGISNGDCGTVTGIEDGCLVVEFDDGKVVEFTSRSATSLILAYAITIHKSQGSEYECVITCFTNEHYVMLQRNLIYTAFSRAKTEMIVFGESQAIATAAQNTSPISRNTRFGEWLVC